MKKTIQKNINIGVHDELSKSEEKLVKLLNYVCLTWYVITIIFIITDYFFEEKYLQVLAGYTTQIVLFIFVQYLQSKRKYYLARIIFVSFAFLIVVVFCNFIVPGKLIEMFYILTPLFSLMFFSNKWIHYTYLLIAICTFVIPKYFLDLYPDELFSDPTTVPIFFISIFLLVSYFKNLNTKNERSLKEKKEEMEDLHNFQNQFFINIAHEIRTPLTILKGNINRLNDDDNDVKKVLRVQANKIQRIVSDVMDLTKMDTNEFRLNKEEVSFFNFTENIYNVFHSNFQAKNIKYQLVDLTDKNCLVSVDKIYLESAISNILTNAIKYTENNGQVSILIEHNSSHISVKIKDSGIGIEEGDLKKVFDRFYQTDNSINRAGGSGVGLAFSKEIISKHNGKLTVESKIGVGSTFNISLPISSLITKSESKPEQRLQIVNSNIENINIKSIKQTILLVEDNQDMSDYISSIICDYNVITAENGLDGIEKLANNKIDYIITDYMMPKMDGYEFIKKIKDDNTTLPILMLTAKTDQDTKLEILRLGIDDYVTKPFEEEELLLRIKNGLKNYSSQQEYIKTEKIPIAESRQNTISCAFISDIKLFISNSCKNENFGVNDICEEFAVSKSTLYRKLKSLTGLSSQGFISEVKLLKAQEIFSNNESLSLKEIGYKVGFVNYTHFSKLYQERFGKVD